MVSGGASGSSANDLSMLRSHIHLMHNLLLFERHRQELHAKRNRRLLGRTVKVVSLEEQNTAMVQFHILTTLYNFILPYY